MRISHLASIAFACSISLFPTASFAQAPADDGRCDDLSDYTPGLYGLCVAYWATQENGNSEASSKILEKYVARQSEANGDPDMPGLCPCWTADELESWESGISGTTTCYGDFGVEYAGWLTDSGSDWVYAYEGDFSCHVAISGSTAISRDIANLDPISFQSCFNDAKASAIAVGCNQI
jgi:hypothetical protein